MSEESRDRNRKWRIVALIILLAISIFNIFIFRDMQGQRDKIRADFDALVKADDALKAADEQLKSSCENLQASCSHAMILLRMAQPVLERCGQFPDKPIPPAHPRSRRPQ